jgi:putative pyoverdin transport system ATP-binding/permease protein
VRALAGLLRERLWAVVAAALVGVLGGLANARLVGLINDEIADAASHPPASVALFIALTAVTFVTGFASEAILAFLSERMSFHLRVNLCGQIMRLPIADVERLGHARLTAAFTQDIPAVDFALLRIPTVFINGTITLGCLVYLGFLSPWILAATSGFLVIALGAYLIPERGAVRYLDAYRQSWDHLITDFDAMNRSAKELKLNYLRRQSFLSDVKRGSADRLRRAALTYRLLYTLLNYWSRALFFLFIALLLYFVPSHISLDLRTVTGFAIIALYLFGPLDQIINAVPRFRAAAVAFSKIQKLSLRLDAGRRDVSLLESGTDPTSVIAPPAVRTIVLRGVTHSYFREKDDRDFLLGPVDLTISTGELVLVTGGNGSGKTTLAKLIAGLYLPVTGEILLDGQPVTSASRERYRQCFSAVFSDFHVLERLVGGPDCSLDDRARAYLQKLHLDHKVKVEAGRLSTTALSSGQRKRLALLAAYLEDRPIYLFDEWASDQDPEFKDVFYHTLLPELRDRGKAVIAITHDDRYFGIADRLIRLHDGQLDPASSLLTRASATRHVVRLPLHCDE